MNEVHFGFIIILSLLSVAFFIAFIRLLKSPCLGDRVVAFDLMTTIGMGFIAVYAIATDQSVFLDVVSVVVLVSFLATIAFAYYMTKKE